MPARGDERSEAISGLPLGETAEISKENRVFERASAHVPLIQRGLGIGNAEKRKIRNIREFRFSI